MRKFLISVCLFAVGITPATACNSEMLELVDWRLIDNGQNRFFPQLLEADVRYYGERSYRMIHGGVVFSDALGRNVAQVNLKRDENVSPGDTIVADGQVTIDERLSAINPEDIRYLTCVWSIVYDDGTVEEFN